MNTGAAPPSLLDDTTFKVSVHGLAEVGKTSLCVRAENDTFLIDGCAPTVLVDFVLCRFHVAASGTGGTGAAEQRGVRLQIYDTAGQERFESGVKCFMRNLAGCLVVFALTSRASFRRAQAYIDEVREESPSAVIVLVGNKLDLIEACADTRADDLAVPRLAGTTLDIAASTTNDVLTHVSVFPSRQHGERVELFPRAPMTYSDLAAVTETRFGLGRDARPAAARGSYGTGGSGARARSARSGGASRGTSGSGSDGDSDSDASVLSLDAESGAVAGTPPPAPAPALARGGVDTTHPDPARRAVARSEAASYARERGFSYVETSAKRGTHVVGAFRLLAERIVAAGPPLRHGASTTALVDLGPSQMPLVSFYEGDADAHLDAVDAALDATEPTRNGCEC